MNAMGAAVNAVFKLARFVRVMDGDLANFESYMREWIGETLGRFALGDGGITETRLIEAVDAELLMQAETAAEVFSEQNWRLAELFATP